MTLLSMKSPKTSLLSKSRIVYFIDEYKSNTVNYRMTHVFFGCWNKASARDTVLHILDRYDLR